ncbi:uncharacterized protein HGUI_03669 [Hanseniaspora guilliermondii]|uniref:PNPLA domain-containing protein n=1 Tax=Hanseniaspora guilliermondii TaxID=56406 RepID=A0A1L0B6K7_9ASCO|nr:uncharacterized protein HGUI_03669 [Hanseniaspora guilliermondii]
MFVTFDNSQDLLDLLHIDSFESANDPDLFEYSIDNRNIPSFQVFLIDQYNKRHDLKPNDNAVPIDVSIFVDLNKHLASMGFQERSLHRKNYLKSLRSNIVTNLKSVKTYRGYYFYKTLLQILDMDESKSSMTYEMNESYLSEFFFANDLDTMIYQFQEALSNQDVQRLEYLILNHWQRYKLKQFSKRLSKNDQFFNLPIEIKVKLNQFNKTCSLALRFLYNFHKENQSLSDYKTLLLRVKKKLGNTAITLSGGGTFALFHVGILVNLFDLNKLPKFVSGCSGGAIVAAIFAKYLSTSEETPYSNIKMLLSTIIKQDLKFEIFDQSESGILNLLLNHSYFKDTKLLQNTLIDFLGEYTTFGDIFEKSGMVLNISVSGGNTASFTAKEFLLNYNNSPNVLLWSSVTSSCSLPAIFPPHMIYSKTVSNNLPSLKVWSGNNQKFLDGSMLQDLPIKKLSEMFNIDNVIASQVNPHIFPVLHIQNFLNKKRLQRGNGKGNTLLRWILYFLEYIYTEITHWLAVLRFTAVANIFKQNYYGDMTVLPNWSLLLKMNKLLTNPTGDFILYLIIMGIKQFWEYSGDYLEYQLFLEFEVNSYLDKIENEDGD